MIPNLELLINSLTVQTAFEKRRLEYNVAIGYIDDLDWAKQLLLEAIAGLLVKKKCQNRVLLVYL